MNYSDTLVQRHSGLSLDRLKSSMEEDGATVWLYLTRSVLTLSKIAVPDELQGQGIGQKAMKKLLAYADANEYTIALTPEGQKGRLTRWYKSLGFVPNKGRYKDYEISESMYRSPV